MHKLSVYVETSVWSQALAEDAPEIRKATERFLAEARNGAYNLFVSDVVMEEIARASEETAERLRGLVTELDPVLLEFDEESFSLAREFLRVGAVPPSKVDDARHVALALTKSLDVLVSWNYRHLVNVRRRELFHQVGVDNGYYKRLQIVTPPEVSDVAE
jgi:predicted nucleic acid-binding protein